MLLYFDMSWGGNINFKFCVSEEDTKFSAKYFKSMLPEDVWPLLFWSCHRFSKNDEGFERLWGLLSDELKDFTLPTPDSICVSR